jgi:hypothetical protein
MKITETSSAFGSFSDKPAWLNQIFKPQPQQSMKITETSYVSGLFLDKSQKI